MSLTHELMGRLCTALAMGVPLDGACRLVAIEPEELDGWIQRGLSDREAGEQTIYASLVSRLRSRLGHRGVAMRGGS